MSSKGMTEGTLAVAPFADDTGFSARKAGVMDILVYLIIGSEIGFWVLLAAGLGARYLLHRRRLGLLLLACVPLLDVVLLAASAADLALGGRAESIHGLAAFYLGFSVAFGRSLIRWADVRVAHRFAGGPAPVKPGKGTPEYRRSLWVEYGRVLLATGIAVAVLVGMIGIVAAPGEAEVLWDWVKRAGLVAGIWLLAGPVYGMFETAPRERAGRR
ncbi:MULTISPECIES: hypothetical protein [unclassified Arthrobacter]|uniref:hypothetical protein n=1 Tax=unclassified Arthrobacter TaxID=235627 RepID=UPI001D15A09D|nr:MULTISPECIES: hypothetical protein [unclassified Arthrobacter]MCC3291323.1 hypothetical protein [Arthrobacter sp. zg-Y1110]MCC3301293.1 hypothetical protein [Arthrobacter sp. zg-Y895]MCC3302540.1 hypothetical protein [Arthrobacter sp. zg-Y895]UWX83746.1 hypothetical protein N2K99_09470 [Arthrobacter sp. zg-Y1110]